MLTPERLALGLIAVLGAGVRLWLASSSRGTNDIATWQKFADFVAQDGVIRGYQVVVGFNHPPLIAYVAMLVGRLAAATHVRFEVLFKLVPLAGDVLSAAVLLRLTRRDTRRAIDTLRYFACALVSVLVTGYHGNTDPLCVAFVLLAAVELDDGRPARAGLAFAAALNVKLIPLVVAPGLVLACRRWRDVVRLAAGTLVGLTPFVPVLVRAPMAFYRNAIAYNSSPNYWGIYGFMLLAGQGGRIAPPAAVSAAWYWTHGRYFILAAVVAAAGLGRLRVPGWSAVRAATVALAAFLVFTPGFGVQYLVYVVPLWLAFEPGRAFLYATTSGLFALLVYYELWTGERPYYSVFNRHYPLAAAWLGAIVWGQLAWLFARALVPPREAAAPTARRV